MMHLKTLDFNDIVEDITTSVLMKHKDYNPVRDYFESIGIAYVLFIAQSKENIDISSIDMFIDTASVGEELNEIVYRYTADNWDIILKYYSQFNNEQLLSFILFYTYDLNNNLMAERTPSCISELACRILDIKDGESVLDLCSGIGSFLIEGYSYNPAAEFTGVELHYANKDIFSIRAQLLGDNVSMVFEDVFDFYSENKFDKLFSHYPFGMKISSLKDFKKRIQAAFQIENVAILRASSEWLFNLLLIDNMNDNGKAVAIIPSSCTWNDKNYDIRKFFVKEGFIEAVIMLPDKLFTPLNFVSCSLIVLSKNNQTVKLIDARHCYGANDRYNRIDENNIADILSMLNFDGDKAISKTIQELEDNDYVLNAIRYLDCLSDMENGTLLKNIVKNITRGIQVKSDLIKDLQTDEKTSFRYLSLSNLTDGIISFDEKEIFLKVVPEKLKKYCIKNNSIVLSKVGRVAVKSAVAQIPDGELVLADGNLIVIEVNEDICNPYYLQSFFASEAGVASFKNALSGYSLPTLSRTNLENLIIPIPSIDIQNNIGSKYAAGIDEIILLKRKLSRTTERMKHIYDEEV